MQGTAISYNLKTAAAATGLSTRTLRRRIAARELKARRVGTILIIDTKELERFLHSCPEARPLSSNAA